MCKRCQRFAKKVGNEICVGCEEYNVNAKDVLMKQLGLQEEIKIETDFIFRLPFATGENV